MSKKLEKQLLEAIGGEEGYNKMLVKIKEYGIHKVDGTSKRRLHGKVELNESH